MIKILTICDSYKHFEDAIKEYKKRLWKKVEIVKLKPSKKDTVDEIIRDETNIIKSYLDKENAYKVILSINWKTISTTWLLDLIEKKEQIFPSIIFVIWGPFWLNYDDLRFSISSEMSLSPMTFPHIEALLILLEQIYRIDTIKQGKSYHY